MSPGTVLWLHVVAVAIIAAPITWLLLPLAGVNDAHTTGCGAGLLISAVVALVLAWREA